MQRKEKEDYQGATGSRLPNPGDFPIGSMESRAAARRKALQLPKVKRGVDAPPPMTMEEWMQMVHHGIVSKEQDEWYLTRYGETYTDWFAKNRRKPDVEST